MAPRRRFSQAWVELLADDPEAVSAWMVARERLAAARHLTRLRRFRLIELSGPLPDAGTQADLLHRSSQFYNPHKERLALRAAEDDPAPLAAGERLVLVTERGGERRPAAERWWWHETGRQIEVCEGVAWALGFAPGEDATRAAADLAVLADRHHGLLCNPRFQDARIAEESVPFPWIKGPKRRKAARS
jgi:hypothetical protein